MLQNTLVLCAVIGFITWYYFNKFQESEREYYKLHKKYEEAVHENARIKSRVKDLQSYKNDVSKTFQILDNELLMINDHLKRRGNNSVQGTLRPDGQQEGISNRVSILTPELLGTLFNNMNQERQPTSASNQVFQRHQGQEEREGQDVPEAENQPVLASLTYELSLNGSPYERFLLDPNSQGQGEVQNHDEQ